jgi:uncharacterized membrane protein
MKVFQFALCALVFAGAALAAPQVRYRITPVRPPPGDWVQASGLNERRELVGLWSSESGQKGFYWRDGVLLDLNPLVSPTVSWVEAMSINNRSQIVGTYADPAIDGVRGFLLDHWQMRDVEGPPGSQHIFANSINDRGVIVGAAYDYDGNFSFFLNDHGRIEVFDSSFEPGGSNIFGIFAGRDTTVPGGRAALWKDGVVTPIAPPFSSATTITERGQVIGYMDANTGSHAFLWERGRLTSLPALYANQTYSWAFGINNAGRIVGATYAGSVSIATMWNDGQVYDLNMLIHPGDPLRAYVTFTSAGPINEFGVIQAQGTDLRVGVPETFLLEPVWR